MSELYEWGNSKIRVVQGTLASSTGGTTILTESGLSSNYIILGYTIMNGSSPYQWVYNNVVSDIYINGNNLVIVHTNSAVNSRKVYIILYKIT